MIKDLFKCGEPEGRMSADERRNQILQVAINLFSQKGFKGTTTKEIARAAGVSEAIIFRHFSTKDELYGAILENRGHAGMKFPWEGNQELLDAMERKDDYTVFYNMALNSLNKQQADVGFMRLLFFSALEEHNLSERFFGEFVSRYYEFVSGYIEQRQKDGAFRDVKPRIVVRAFMGMLIHHSLNNNLWDKNRLLLDISNEEAAANFAEILLRGIRN